MARVVLFALTAALLAVTIQGHFHGRTHPEREVNIPHRRARHVLPVPASQDRPHHDRRLNGKEAAPQRHAFIGGLAEVHQNILDHHHVRLARDVPANSNATAIVGKEEPKEEPKKEEPKEEPKKEEPKKKKSKKEKDSKKSKNHEKKSKNVKSKHVLTRNHLQKKKL